MAAAVATAIAPVSIIAGELFQYVTFDYLWWVLTAWMMIRLLKSEDPRWFLGIGAAVGLGLLTKYTIGVLVIAMAGGLLFTSVAALAQESLALGRHYGRVISFPAQRDLAAPPSLDLARFPAFHPCARRPHWKNTGASC